MPDLLRTRSFQPTTPRVISSSSAPLSTPAVARPATPAAPATPLAPVTPSALPRSLVSEATHNSGLRNPAVAAALFGLQGIGMLVGTPASAHAAELPPVTGEQLATRLAELEANKGTMSPSELATARRALFSAYTRLSQAQATSFPFETEWASAPAGSLDRPKVADALKQMGAEGTEAKLLAVHAAYADKLTPAARADLEVAIAGRMLDAAAKDGALDTTDVTSVETKLQGKLGDEAGTRAILRAFPTHLDALDDGAIGHLLSRASAVSTHAARLVSVVDEMMAGKNVVVDVNADGKLDTGDVVLTQDTGGKHLVERVTKAFADEARVNKAMVDASYTMADAGVSFKLMKDHKANPDFFTVSGTGTLLLKPGVKPSDAMNDIMQNGSKYGFECATGLVVVYYQAMLNVLGPADFDRVASDLKIGPWVMEDDLSRLMINSYPHADKVVETELGDVPLTPGGYYYFRNWDVTDDARARGWQGENVIYLGEGKFYGHGIGLGDASMFVNKLAGEMKPGGQTPSLLNLTARLSTDLVKLDRDPN